MSNTITIVRKEETTTESVYPVPSFYKEEYSGNHVAILDEKTAVSIYQSSTGGAVSVSTPESIMKYRTDLEPIDRDTFYRAYNKCIQDITQAVAKQ